MMRFLPAFIALVVLVSGCGSPLDVTEKSDQRSHTSGAQAGIALQAQAPVVQVVPAVSENCTSSGSSSYDPAALLTTVRGIFQDLTNRACGLATDEAMAQLNACKASRACPAGQTMQWGGISSTACGEVDAYSGVGVLGAFTNGINASENYYVNYQISMSINGSCVPATSAPARRVATPEVRSER